MTAAESVAQAGPGPGHAGGPAAGAASDGPGLDAAIGPDSVVVLHDLAIRPDDEEWIVGRAATGEFAALPDEAKTVIDLLAAGLTVAEAKRRADERHAADLDVADFVADLIDLGFVAAVDGRSLDEPPPAPSSLPWLRPSHVRWAFTRPAAVVLAAFILFGFTVAVHRSEWPTWRAFFAFDYPGVNLLIAMSLSGLNAAVHESWHLAAARAAGIDGRISFGTRLIFLVAQTSVPGLWAADRRARLRFCLAGMTWDLTLTSACLLVASATPHPSVAHRLCELLALIILLAFGMQFAFFIRTDFYLVVQELLRCKNLHADAVARLRWLGARIRARRGGPDPGPDPTSALPARERRPVKVFAVLVALGTTLVLAMFVVYQLPILVLTLYRSAVEVVHAVRDGSALRIVDGALTLFLTAGYRALFLRTFVRNRRRRTP